MKGENFTRIGLLLFAVGIILLITWTVVYDKETDIYKEGKVSEQGKASKILLATGASVIGIGYASCIAGFSIASDFLDFSLKIPKTNLIET
jgi:hypothetical protein